MDIDTGSAPWRVTPPYSSNSMQAVVAPMGTGWTSSLLPALWVAPLTPPGADPKAPGDYVYEFRFRVPQCSIAGATIITGSYAADNEARLYLDGGTAPLSSSVGAPGMGFTTANVTAFTIVVPYSSSGVHTLRVVVHNNELYHGLAMRASIRNSCTAAT